MRKSTFIGGEVVYPSEMAFAFNRNLIVVSGINGVMRFTVTDGTKSYDDVREPYDGLVRMDISKYLQMFFDREELAQKANREVDVTIRSGSEAFHFSMLVIWGVVNVGERFNTDLTLRWFKNLPFELDLFVPGNIESLFGRYDREPYEKMDHTAGIMRVSPIELFPDAEDKAVITETFGERTSTFDDSFDYTFFNYDNYIRTTLIVDDTTCGTYLRWLDRHGFIRYYLFKDGDESYKHANYGDGYDTDFNDGEYHHYDVKRPRGKTMQRTRKLCAPLSEAYERNTILSLLSSPLVWWYVDGIWCPVNIVTGTHTLTGENLQDFEIQLEYPETVSQLL